jgi:predicted lipoprotein with Yx(FWY)xxD motif
MGPGRRLLLVPVIPPRVRALSAGAAGAAGLVLVLTGCGHRSSADPLLELPVPTQVSVQTETVAGLGTVLTDSGGHALYLFPPDAARKVTCVGACLGTWPPLLIAPGHTPSGAGSVQAARLGTLPSPETGGDVVTYAGHPLYRYAGDVTAATANGQALFSDGGPWYVLGADGQPVVTNPAGS